jgi:hypothetical protein
VGKRYGDERVNQACAIAVQAEMFDVHRLQRMLKLAPAPTTLPAAASATSSSKVVPIARYLRSPSQYALPFPPTAVSTNNSGENR